jgi:hypothetical protein
MDSTNNDLPHALTDEQIERLAAIGVEQFGPRLSRTQFSKPPPSQAAVALASFPRAQFRNRMIPSRSWSVTLLAGAPELTAGSCDPEMRWNPAPTLTVR